MRKALPTKCQIKILSPSNAQKIKKSHARQSDRLRARPCKFAKNICEKIRIKKTSHNAKKKSETRAIDRRGANFAAQKPPVSTCQRRLSYPAAHVRHILQNRFNAPFQNSRRAQTRKIRRRPPSARKTVLQQAASARRAIPKDSQRTQKNGRFANASAKPFAKSAVSRRAFPKG